MAEYSKTPSFKDHLSDSAISELVLRIIAINQNDDWIASGTATCICKSLALTAKHVIKDFLDQFGFEKINNRIMPRFRIKAIQILQGSVPYAVWDVNHLWLSPQTDAAILYLRPFCENAAKYRSWKSQAIDLLPPKIGERVSGFGYRSSAVKITTDSSGHKDIKINDKPTATVGEVREIHVLQRDSNMNFPCYQVNARFDGGMSGGPIFNDNGYMCGIICSNIPPYSDNEEHTSYVASLWPLMATTISANRKGDYPHDVNYPIYDLAKGGIIHTKNLEKVKIKHIGNDRYEAKLENT